jgi:ADP-L-glycero-D-manno-heptose 6-epimerase
MIVITGAAGFIGSVLLGYLNKLGRDDIVCVDDLIFENQSKNLIGKKFYKLYSSQDVISEYADTVIHLGANSNTLEKSWNSIYTSNVNSTRRWSDYCKKNDSKFIFASSAAVYGNGQGPMNQYAFSKLLSENEIDIGMKLRLFNVYGPNEYHKQRMASTVFHWYKQYIDNKQIKVFENSKYYSRDFIYVEDVAKIINYCIANYNPGIFDIGTGSPVDFDALADLFCDIFEGAEKVSIPMPADLIPQYQKYSCADLTNFKNIGFDESQLSKVDDGVKKYSEFLQNNLYY